MISTTTIAITSVSQPNVARVHSLPRSTAFSTVFAPDRFLLAGVFERGGFSSFDRAYGRGLVEFVIVSTSAYYVQRSPTTTKTEAEAASQNPGVRLSKLRGPAVANSQQRADLIWAKVSLRCFSYRSLHLLECFLKTEC